jgi:hypothetical protein
MFREHPVLQINTRPGHLYTDASSAPYNSPLWTVKCLHDSELILQFDSHECTAKVTGMVETSRLSNEDLTWMGARTRLGLQQTQQYLCQDTGCSRQGGGGVSVAWISFMEKPETHMYTEVPRSGYSSSLQNLISAFPIYSCKDQNTSDCNSTGYFTTEGTF